jgi:WD40 repeat protein
VPGEPVRVAELSPDGRSLATLGDSTVMLWSLEGETTTGRALDGLGEVATDEVERRSLQFGADGATLLAVRASSFQAGMAVWRVADGTLLHSNIAIEDRCARLSPDGSRLVVCALRIDNANEFVQSDVQLISWDDSVRTVVLPGSGTTLDTRIIAAEYSPDGRQLALRGERGRLQLWPATGTGRPVVLGSDSVLVTAFAYSPDGDRVAVAWSDRSVTLLPASWSAAASALRAQLVQCLVPNVRVTLLGELPGDAQRGWERCERRLGR